ncbi:uncharacterized protein LOC126909150 isoform X2 [Daktulosphaira vitifoliae]|uniref:uncharacterized protein LOC126909150 isoform X2 n=1 Tax=Daktulosphaira vitifoliae TaxID=58002 RepID=UPI0021A9CA3E|nr:uncharacterized protein LOC126909150 isoform X2 [Daktulosphaira vitifoliae]
MLPKLFYSICYTFWILTTKCFVSCKIKPKTYEKYLSVVIDHISEQVGWDSMQHLKINLSTGINYNIKDVICKGSRIILSKKFDAIIHILNYMYAEVIKTFIDHISAIAKRCQEYYDFNQGDNLLSCTVLLQSAVENSKTMFEQLYNVMNYLSNIDFKILASAKKTFSIPIVDEIYTFVEYATLKSQQNIQIFIDLNDPNTIKDAYKVILDVNNFIEGKGHKTYQKIKKKNSLIVNNHKPKFSLEENLKDYNAQQNKNFELSYYLSEWLNMYYVEISTNLYNNLGFEQVLNLYEEGVRHPVYLYENINQKEGIELINAITKESGWKSLKPIYIVFNDQVISVDRILRHPADRLNFHCKKEHILRVIKCIYTEILFKYCDYVFFLIDFCETEKVNSNDVMYTNFVRQIFDAIHKTTKMFDIMYKTLVSLNELIGEYFHDNVNSNLKCFCSLISKLLEEINSGNYSLDVLDGKSDTSEQRVPQLYAKTCVKNISTCLNYHKSKNRSLIMSHDKQCPLQILLLKIDIPKSINTKNFSTACNELVVFSKNFIKVYYEELGLNKLK